MTIAGGDRPLPSRAMDRETARDRVHPQLVSMIPDGEIEAGRTVMIAQALHVSAMPVRE